MNVYLILVVGSPFKKSIERADQVAGSLSHDFEQDCDF